MENLLTNELETELISYPQVFDVVNFMCAGVVGYSDVDDGVYLLRKETLEKMLPSIIGRPVVIDHQKITKENIENLAVGYVTGARYNHESGQFDCTILITDKETAEKIKTALFKTLEVGIKTADLGGNATCSKFTESIISYL